MACRRMGPRELRRQTLAEKYSEKRKQLKVIADNRGEQFTFDEIREAQKKLRALPRDASPSRQRRRCGLCGRPHGVLRKFRMCRLCVRKYGMRGFIPGLVFSSW